jgi:hypothetical protein
MSNAEVESISAFVIYTRKLQCILLFHSSFVIFRAPDHSRVRPRDDNDLTV